MANVSTTDPGHEIQTNRSVRLVPAFESGILSGCVSGIMAAVLFGGRA